MSKLGDLRDTSFRLSNLQEIYIGQSDNYKRQPGRTGTIILENKIT